MNKIWFSSDFHWSHKNISGPKLSRWKDGYRNFDNTFYMNKALYETINKYVEEDDILYFLGDFAFGGEANIAIYRNLINCKTIHFISGNHDKNALKHPECFTTIQDELRLEIDGIKLWLRHHPEPTYKGNRLGVYHLYGHTHGKIPFIENSLSMDVGIDHAYKLFGEYRPFELHEIIEIINKNNNL